MEETKVEELDAKLAELQTSVDKLRSGERMPAPYAEPGRRGALDGATESPMQTLDRRIALAPPQEAAQLTMIRQELTRQQESSADRAHVRHLEGLNFYAKVALSFTAFGTGVGLVATGFAMPGFVCLGAALYTIAPDFINKVTDRIVGEKKE
jgi:hypothetical protein